MDSISLKVKDKEEISNQGSKYEVSTFNDVENVEMQSMESSNFDSMLKYKQPKEESDSEKKPVKDEPVEVPEVGATVTKPVS